MKKTMMKVLSVVLVLIMMMLPLSVFAEEGVTYEIMGAFEIGTKTYASSSLEYTVYYFEPSEVGKYTISTTNSLIGIGSYNGMWVTTEPTAETVKDTSLVWECKAVGQSIYVSALSKAEGVTITVIKEGIQIEQEITVYYENKKTPQAFAFDGDANALEYVDVEDGNKDSAVLGADGFYHLNSANGPRLFMCLDDTMMSFYKMREPGQLSAIKYNPDGIKEYKIDYNGAFDEYWACVDSATFLYPLTDDLIIMAKNISDARGWFKEGGWLEGIDPTDGWMFCCQYIVGESFENNEITDGEQKDDESFNDEIIQEGGDGGANPDNNITSGVGSDGNYTGGVSGTTNNTIGTTPGGNAGNATGGSTTNGANNGANNAGSASGGSTNGATGGTSHQTGDVSVAIICVLAVAVVGAVVTAIVIRKKKNNVEF